jgi:hypothetical protein
MEPLPEARFVIAQQTDNPSKKQGQKVEPQSPQRAQRILMIQEPIFKTFQFGQDQGRSEMSTAGI